jgi:hypothetical protein
MMVEARSAPARLMNEGKMSRTGLQQAVARLEAQRSSWLEVAPSDNVRNLAAEIPEQYGLRALDSFQLAAGLVWCREKPRGRLFVCGDAILVNAAFRADFGIYP